MTNTQLDPELELEAQQLANYEDELREFAEEINAQEDYIKEHEKELIEGQNAINEIIADEENNKQGIVLKRYSIENFRKGRNYQSFNEDGEDDGFSIVNCFEYGSMFGDFRIAINEYSGGGRSLFIHMKKDGFFLDLSKHSFDDYQKAIDSLNSMAPFIYDVQLGNI